MKGNYMAVLRILLDIVRRLVGFFTLTEEERLLVGIRLGDEGRDE